jgi:hypothetical protein
MFAEATINAIKVKTIRAKNVFCGIKNSSVRFNL